FRLADVAFLERVLDVETALLRVVAIDTAEGDVAGHNPALPLQRRQEQLRRRRRLEHEDTAGLERARHAAQELGGLRPREVGDAVAEAERAVEALAPRQLAEVAAMPRDVRLALPRQAQK